MEEGLLSLKWNNHKTTFFEVLSKLREKELFTDATLACEGKFFPVHKVVLSTCSDYFNEIFQKIPCKSPFIVLKDVKQKELQLILDYMYLGEVDVKQTNLAMLMNVAESLQVKGLAVPDESPSDNRKRSPEPDHGKMSLNKRRKRSFSGNNDHTIQDSWSNEEQHSPLLTQNKPLLPVDTIKIEQADFEEEMSKPTPYGDESNSVQESGNEATQCEKFEVEDYQESLTDNVELEKFELPNWEDPGSSHQVHTKDTSNQSSTCHDSDSLEMRTRTPYQRRQVIISEEMASYLQKRKVHNCRLCTYKTAYKSHFEAHMRTHTGERPFVCHLCSYKSKQKSALTFHIKKCH